MRLVMAVLVGGVTAIALGYYLDGLEEDYEDLQHRINDIAQEQSHMSDRQTSQEIRLVNVEEWLGAVEESR